MKSKLVTYNITSGYRSIKDRRQFEYYFTPFDDKNLIIKDGEIDDTVNLITKVVWKYIDDTKKITAYLKRNNVKETCHNI